MVAVKLNLSFPGHKTNREIYDKRGSRLCLHINACSDASGFAHMAKWNLALNMNLKTFLRKISDGENHSRTFHMFSNWDKSGEDNNIYLAALYAD